MNLSFVLKSFSSSSNQIGFVQGHSYLNANQIRKIKGVLDSNNNEEIIKEYEKQMSALIGPGYGLSFAAGRMAFFSLLKALNIGAGDEVILPGFTCSVMPNAIYRTGAIPVYSDISSETLGSDADEIERKITPRTKLIVAQHSFGIPCNIREIVDLGLKYGIFIVEDCAITLDSSVDGIKVGNWGDAAIFSTDHSKPLNTIIGGFLYTKNKPLYEKTKTYHDTLPHLDRSHQKRLYNQLLFERKYYTPSRYSRLLIINHIRSFIKRLGPNHNRYTFLEADYRRQASSNPGYPYPAKMPPFLAQIGLFEIDRWGNEKKRRKDLLQRYLNIMVKMDYTKYLPKAYFHSNVDIVPLRFVFTYPESERLIRKMSQFIDIINWIWFRSPIICCPDGSEGLGYTFGSCKIAEEICNSIINWPCVLPVEWDDKVLNIFHQIINDMQLK